MAKDQVSTLSEFCSDCGETINSSPIPSDDYIDKQSMLRFDHQKEFDQMVEDWKKTHCCACCRPSYNLEHAFHCEHYRGLTDQESEKVLSINLEEIKEENSFLTVEKEDDVLVFEEYPLDESLMKKDKKKKMKTSVDNFQTFRTSNFSRKKKSDKNSSVIGSKERKKENNNKGFIFHNFGRKKFG